MPEERKLVSILFADVTGSTALADSMDAEDIRALMSRYYEHARRIISPYGGTLEKFIGDAIMAVFGLSQAHGDDAERALAAALALRAAIATDEILAPHFQLRIGVNTGEVVATSNPASLDFLITGDAVNVAARLQQGANPGEIIASERTAHAAQNAFVFAEERELQAKGKHQPLHVFLLTSPRAARQVERPPFVGRRQDLLQLDVLKERVLEERRPQLAAIVAPAGTGKSRLLEEFLHRLSPDDGFQVAFARCLPYGQTLTYWPLRGLLSELLGAVPEKDRVQAIFLHNGYGIEDAARLADLVLTTLGIEEKGESAKAKPAKKNRDRGNSPATLDDSQGWKELANLEALDAFDPMVNAQDWMRITGLDELNTLTNSSVPPDPARIRAITQAVQQQSQALEKSIHENVERALREVVPTRFRATDRESMFEAWRLLIEALAIQAPRIIIFEDLHWASDSLLDFVEYLMHLRTSAPLLMIVLSRPELLDRRSTWAGGRQNFTSLALQPLDEQLIRDLIIRIDSTIPTDVRDGIVTRAGGNPFFALELLHAFSELNVKGKATDAALLPDTVHAAILARIDLLNQPERAILQIASVAGRAFRLSMLRAILDDYRAKEVEAALDDLVARDILIPLTGETYNFRHVLFRDVAYGTLSRSERIRLHSNIAQWMASLAHNSLDEYVELIAYHYREALQLSRQSAVPLALPFQKEAVASIFERAGLLASRSGSFAEANSNFLLAIELAPTAEHMRLQETRGDNVAWGSTAYEAYSQALTCWRATPDKDAATGARLIYKVLNVATRVTMSPVLQPSDTATLRNEGLQLAANTGNVYEQWRLRVTECFDPKFWFSGRRNDYQADLPPLKEIALQAATYFEQQKSWAMVSEALDGCANVAIYMHKWQDALEYAKRRLAIPELPPEEWVDVIYSVALIYSWLGDYPNCIASIQSALAQLKPGHPVASLGKLITLLSEAYFLIGEWDEVIRLLPRLQEIHELVQYDQHSTTRLIEGYTSVLQVALAREDRAMSDVTSTIVQKYAHLLGPTFQQYITAILTGDSAKIMPTDELLPDIVINLLSPYFNEARVSQIHGISLLHSIQHLMQDESELMPQYQGDYLRISLALQENNDAHLAHAIDEAEAHQLIPHAARMRIVLAQRTRDRSQLERARPVLERLGDRVSLRKLEEVAQEFV